MHKNSQSVVGNRHDRKSLLLHSKLENVEESSYINYIINSNLISDSDVCVPVSNVVIVFNPVICQFLQLVSLIFNDASCKLDSESVLKRRDVLRTLPATQP